MSKHILILGILSLLASGCKTSDVKVFDNSALVFKKYVMFDKSEPVKNTKTVVQEKKKAPIKPKTVKTATKTDLANGAQKLLWKTKYMERELILHVNGEYSSRNKGNEFQAFSKMGTWTLMNSVLKLKSNGGAVSLFNEPKIGNSYAAILGTHGYLLKQ
jgi:hypothetical protein